MTILRSDTFPIRNETDLVVVRQAVRAWMVDLRFGMVDQTKIVTAASELGRNALVHGGGGQVRLETLEQNGKAGIRLVFEDQGPGIPDVQLALKDGFTTGKGMGLGLPGARRLVSEFDIESRVGQGTRVTIVRWK